MIGAQREGRLTVDPSDDRRSRGILNCRAEARQPVDPARPVENAQNAFPTRSLENRTERGFPHAPQAYSFFVFNEQNDRAVPYPG
jgi:hypothetical protein